MAHSSYILDIIFLVFLQLIVSISILGKSLISDFFISTSDWLSKLLELYYSKDWHKSNGLVIF